MRQVNQVVTDGSTAYTTGVDFCRIFAEEMKSLYLLGLLLTADAEKAEQCFVAGIGDCVDGNPVFREWARSWARRAIMRNAIQMLAPAAKPAVKTPERFGPEIDQRLLSVLRLDTLQRFVFVMSVLEGYSYQDCSILLGCSRQTVISARTRALAGLSRADEIRVVQGDAAQSTYALSN